LYLPYVFNYSPSTQIYTLSLHDALPISFVPSLAEKNTLPLTFVSKEGFELPLGLMSLTMKVPAAVPSLVHSSVPLLPSVAWKNRDRKSTRLNSSHQIISYAVFCLKKKKQ